MAKGTGRNKRAEALELIQEDDPERYEQLRELMRWNPQAFRKALRREVNRIQRENPGRGAKVAAAAKRRDPAWHRPQDASETNEITERALEQLEGLRAARAAAVDEINVDVVQMGSGRKPSKRRPSTANYPGAPSRAPANPRPDAAEADLSVLDGSVGSVKEALETGAHDAYLEALLDAEEAGKARKGVLSAIAKRLG